jgi:uncharacterized protein (TIGR02147 family)
MNQNLIEKPSIYHFTSLELFLTSYFNYKKIRNPHFSYQLWANRLEIQTPSLICMILKGTRIPSPRLATKLKIEIGLNEKESHYFDLLSSVKKNGHDVVKSVHLMGELEKSHPQKGFKLIEQDQFKTISNWYYYAILEAVECSSFVEDPTLLSRQFDFSISKEDLIDAMTTLLRLNLLKRNKKGKLQRAIGSLTTQSDRNDEGLKIFHEQSLKNALESIRTQQSHEREILGLSLCIEKAKLPKAKKKIRAFIEEFCQEFDGGSKADQIYQLECCFFRTINLTNDKA